MVTTAFLNCIMGNVFGSDTSVALPATYYIGLSTTTPNADGTGVTEPSGNGYTRVAVTSLSAPVSGVVSNTSDISFPESTGDWGTVTHYVLFSAQSGGDHIMWDSLANAKTIQAETQVRFRANSLKFTLTAT